MSVEQELLPCPFCGGKAVGGFTFGRRSVSCTNCPSTIRSIDVCGLQAEVDESWNKRTAIKGFIDSMEARIESIKRNRGSSVSINRIAEDAIARELEGWVEQAKGMI